MNVDGVIAIDPVALSYMLGAVGPVTMPDGEVVTKDNVVELTESTAYSRFPTDQTARKKYLQDIANEVVKKMTGRIESPRKLLDALGKAVSERRIAVWSSSPADQKLLEETPLAHVVPDDPAPYAEVVINNLGGNKLDYYLKEEIEYAADGCDGETRKSTVTVRLTNTAPDGPLPDYVASSAGLLPEIPIKVPSGTMVSSVRLLATKDAKLVSALANGQRVPVFHRHGTRSPDLRSTGSHTARAIRRIELPPFRTDVSGRTACSDSAVTGRCHSGCIGARMLGMRSQPRTDLRQSRRRDARRTWPPHRRQLSRHLLKSSLLARDRRIRFVRHVPDSERRIAVWSSSPADQKLLEETPLAHVVPDDPAPYAGVVINNLGGNKLDYYLKVRNRVCSRWL